MVTLSVESLDEAASIVHEEAKLAALLSGSIWTV